MDEVQYVTELVRDSLYSVETLMPVIKLMLPFAIAAVVLILLKALLKALANFIKRIRD